MRVQCRVTEDQPVMLGKMRRGHRQGLALQIARAGAEQDAVGRQRAGDQVRQLHRPVAHGQVIAATLQVDEFVGELHVQAHLWVLLKKAVAGAIEKGRGEGGRRHQAQGAAHFLLQALDVFPGLLQLAQYLPGAGQVDIARPR